MSYAPIPNKKEETCTRRIQLEDLNTVIVSEKRIITKMRQQEKENAKTKLLKAFLEILQFNFLKEEVVGMVARDETKFDITIEYTKEESQSFDKFSVDAIIYRNLDELLTKDINKEEFNGINWNKSIYSNLCDMLPEEFTVYSSTYSHLNKTEFSIYKKKHIGYENMFCYILFCCDPMCEHR